LCQEIEEICNENQDRQFLIEKVSAINENFAKKTSEDAHYRETSNRGEFLGVNIVENLLQFI
jgi:hypothetical protein